MGGYRSHVEAARRRLANRERRSIRDPLFGGIECAEWGEGPALVLSHPLFGGFDVGGGLAETYVGDGYRFVAPSRFGYLRSSLPQGAMPADQADAYAALLDALGIDRSAIFGYSAGAPSAIQFALRHPDRTTGLILMASALPGKAGAPPQPVAQMLFGSDLLFWLLKRYAPSLFARILGMPKAFRPTPDQRQRIVEVEESFFPIRPRKAGVLFDLYVSNPDVQGYPLEEIAVPTLIINTKDDGLSAFENAVRAAERIPGSKLLGVERGGHLLLGSERLIRSEVAAVMAGAVSSHGPGRAEQ
jgi:pimeloyl-ACP methyl ester carboxylesterase